MNSPYTSRSFILGVTLIVMAYVFYTVVTDYFYYGGGWPVVPIISLVLYLLGVTYIFKSNIHRLAKWIISFWWLPVTVVIILFNILFT